MEVENECARCGKKIDLSKGAYGLSLTETRPKDDKLFPGEDVFWSSSPYCSRKCLKKSLNQIRNQLMTWLQEEGWATESLKR